MNTLILASSSPQRTTLLSQIGVPHEISLPSLDSSPLPHEKPLHTVARLALEKAKSVHDLSPHNPVLAADTLVTMGRRILGKPSQDTDAISFLSQLSGRRHQVISGVCLILPSHVIVQKTVVSTVAFKRLSHDEISSYIQSLEWKERAGGYAIQGKAAAFIRFISGSYSNVVGLPLFETSQMLRAHNLIPPSSPSSPSSP